MKNKYLPFLLIVLNINILLSKKLNFRNTASCSDYLYSPSKENVKIIGRYYQKNDIKWIIYSDSAIEF